MFLKQRSGLSKTLVFSDQFANVDTFDMVHRQDNPTVDILPCPLFHTLLDWML